MRPRLPLFAYPVVLLATLRSSAQAKPIDLSLGWTYAYADQGSGPSNLNGWYGIVNWEATQRMGVAFSHQSFWGGFAGTGVNQHAYLGGITVELRQGNPKVKPFVQPLGGVTRSSSSGSIQMQPTFQVSAGADTSLKGKLSLEVVPAEYTFSYAAGSGLNTYEAGAGFQYSFRKR